MPRARWALFGASILGVVLLSGLAVRELAFGSGSALGQALHRGLKSAEIALVPAPESSVVVLDGRVVARVEFIGAWRQHSAADSLILLQAVFDPSPSQEVFKRTQRLVAVVPPTTDWMMPLRVDLLTEGTSFTPSGRVLGKLLLKRPDLELVLYAKGVAQRE